MSIQQSIGEKVIAEDLRLSNLLKSATLVGGIYTMGFQECSIVTNDLWKEKASGVPQHCFLLAAPFGPQEVPTEGDEEVILLRVISGEALPVESELVRVREEAMREIIMSEGSESASEPSTILDVLTKNEIQFSGLRGKILGTFYEYTSNSTTMLEFGSDVESFHSASRYKVYKPHGQSLSIIASYPEITEEEAKAMSEEGSHPRRIQVGTVRYSSSRRRSLKKKSQEAIDEARVPVRVNVEDFIAMKTAVFGMTRLGKSNTMKILATAIFRHALEERQKIGQLLFDPSGEYANVNRQDETALAELGPEYVSIFRFGSDSQEAGVRLLTTNFFDEDQIEMTWTIIRTHLRPRRQEAIYIESFCSADVIGPASERVDRSGYNRTKRRRAALYASLIRAGFAPHDDFKIRIMAKSEVVEAVNQQLSSGEEEFTSDRQGRIDLHTGNIVNWHKALAKAIRTEGFPPNWSDSELEAILDVFEQRSGAGYRLLEGMRVYHSPSANSGQGDFTDAALEELANGKIVIIDLSEGAESVLQFSAERIINHILDTAARRFRKGLEPFNIQIYLEEAHNLFSRDRMERLGEDDPYVRLAKEAAKYKIGLIYATQEVTSVDTKVLSNTSNWIVTHLNNRNEIKELSKYYDFEDFSDTILRAEDVGFARLKSKSGRYLIPLQIDLFTSESVNIARQTALETSTNESGET